jgi:hypothetical protein
MKSKHNFFQRWYVQKNYPDISFRIQYELILNIRHPIYFIEDLADLSAFELTKQLDDLNEIKTQKT